jgi:hypothetical protein
LIALNKISQSFYNWDGYDKGGKNWAYSEVCSNAEFDENHFRFYLPYTDSECLLEYNTLQSTGGQASTDMGNENYHAFYATDDIFDYRFETCFVKVLVKNGQNEIFTGKSSMGIYSDTEYPPVEHSLYGLRNRCPNDKDAAICLEVKHSGSISNHDESSPSIFEDRTLVSIIQSTNGSNLNCRVTKINKDFLKDDTITRDDEVFEFYLRNVTYGQDYGIYCHKGALSKADAKEQAAKKCWSGKDKEYDKMPPDIKKNHYLVEFTCS